MTDSGLKSRDREFNIMILIISILISILMACPSFAADFYLWAGKTTEIMPDTGQIVTMWGYALEKDKDFTTLEGTIQVPGPVLTVPPGDTTVTIHLYNNLPSFNGPPPPASIVIPGQIAAMTPVRNPDGRIRSFTHETAYGTTVVYTWTDFKPGTYLYQSGTHPAIQVQMGLYGCIKKDADEGKVYPDIPYDKEVIIFYSEIDPSLHTAVATNNYGPGKGTTSTINYHPEYFLINGAPYPSTPTLPEVKATEQILMRFLNAGLETHVPLIQGLYMSIIAEDGNVLPFPKEQYSLMLAAGKTMDAIIMKPQGGIYPIFDQRLCLTNATSSPGGMLTYLKVSPVPETDMVAISKVEYINKIKDRGRLQVTVKCDAPFKSSNLTAVANYIGGESVSLGTLRRGLLWHTYQGNFRITPMPDSITIYSSGGGADIKPVPYLQMYDRIYNRRTGSRDRDRGRD